MAHRFLPIIVAACVAFAGPVAAQQTKMPGMDMDETKSGTPYHPGLGDLMTAFVQPRHIKLGLAGAAQNWDYAAYELGELREAFAEARVLVTKHGKLAITPAIASTVAPAMVEVERAIRAKNPTDFTKAYAGLTEACNACHRSAEHASIVIQVPSTSAFPDQDFNPPKP